MSWVTDKAVKRIFSTFKRLGKQIYKEDIDALKTINDTLNFEKQSFVADNKVFSKLLALYIYEKYKSDKDINSVINNLSKSLQYDLQFILERLHNKIQTTELIQYIDTLTVDVPESEFKDIEALTNKENEFWTIHQKEIFKKIKEQYSSDFVKNSFYNTADDILKTVEFTK